MKTTIIIIMTLGAASLFAAPPTVRGRQVNQQARIAQGVRSGSLTRGETARIETREARVARSIRRDRIDGGGLSAFERAKIQGQQNALSNQIYDLKHNGRVR
jgi:hypothetical protein